jgi:putative ATP-dependent endonuclease of the OLD family
MKLKRVLVENARSFLGQQELFLDGPISILIGPNGGGKTNLLDICVVALRKHLLRSWSRRFSGNPSTEEFYVNEQVDQLALTKHREGRDARQFIELQVEITDLDIQNMLAMKRDAQEFDQQIVRKYNRTVSFENAKRWPDPLPFAAGEYLHFNILNGRLEDTDEKHTFFRQYLELYEVDTMLREELGKAPLSLPLLSLPTNRSNSGFGTSVSLPSFNQFDHKRSVDAATSKSGGGLVEMALGRLAIKHRLLREQGQRRIRERLRRPVASDKYAAPRL